MQIKCFVVGEIQTNLWFIEDQGQVLLVDPGGFHHELNQLLEDYQLRGIFITHGHIDHIAGIKTYLNPELPVYIGESDKNALGDPRENLSTWLGSPFSIKDCRIEPLSENETLRLGELEFKILELPGHSPGSLGLYLPGHLFSGDVLFHHSVGRTDFPGGDFEVLENSIRKKLYALPDETLVHPGHGPETTIGEEKRNNPFFPV